MSVLVAALFLVLLVVTGALAAPATPGGAAVLPHLLTAALYLAAGLIAWRRRPHNRIGLLMLLAGLSLWVAVLDHSPSRSCRRSGALGATCRWP